MLSILRKEFNDFFSTAIGYLAIGIFIVFIGLNTWVFKGNIFDYGYATLIPFFQLMPWLFIFLVPAITMRLFSNEISTGSIETIATKPVSNLQIVIGKYLSACLVLLTIIVFTLLYFFCIKSLALNASKIDFGAIMGSYLGLFLLGCTFTSIGLFASIISKNQLLAFIIGVLLCYIFYDAFDQINQLNSLNDNVKYWIQKLGSASHYEAFSRGIIDSRDVVYFLSVITIFTVFTQMKLKSRNW